MVLGLGVEAGWEVCGTGETGWTGDKLKRKLKCLLLMQRRDFHLRESAGVEENSIREERSAGYLIFLIELLMMRL